MADARVLAAVVTDSIRPGVAGFVDVLDLMAYVLDVTAESRDITKESIRNLKWEGQCLSRAATGDLINYSQSNAFVSVKPGTSLLDVVVLFAKQHHRVAVMEDNKLINIISQFDVLEFLTTRGVWLGCKMTKPIADVGLGPLGLASVRKDMNVVDVLRYMKDNKIAGVAVVDANGRMVANFSASDLVGLNENNFQLLTLPVMEFLTRIHGFPKPPVFCKVSDTVEVVMLRLLVHKVHRTYIVDESMEPQGVITLTDIMQFLLAV